ncbi:tRNA (adenine22-N1)-methyltransferase [Mycoplasmoides fastidiosum]|uniref:tRNA (Adenine22-N1)-methyltransferase n=1 Tax=Mycoplasmoides fastidiosum TaxID=92758 RepID=A0ABU0LZQ7_9BACT|nr:tRNA (adenine(22)-N(1))-methyltransferase TrmK [Mycoplasmoides fastidiosum]MDQ0514186.1 tRNA (adenine22-N1)-methyltransferase [Mycoplasmoides fastidiosum]UUD37402.1 class I SAM-dependent methyltransferase [Mycoplasmoides fastidiosum]
MKRLTKILDLMLTNQLLIDVGADHGYLGIEALKQQKTKFVWNVEITKGPLLNAQNNFIRAGYVDQATFWTSDGFIKLPQTNATSATAVCAGMGTQTILKILKHLPIYVDQIILLTHTLGYKLRKWASENRWYVLAENYVASNHKIYELIYLVRDNRLSTKQYQSETDYWLGLKEFYETADNQLYFQQYWSEYLAKFSKIPAEKRSDYQTELIKLIENLINEKPIN